MKKIIGNFLEPGAYKTYGTQTKNNKGNHNGNINHKAFAQRLWGDVYIDNETNKFFVGSKNKKIDVNSKRTFVSFILDSFISHFILYLTH